MSIQTEKEFIGMQTIGEIVANCLVYMRSRVQAGMTTEELDEIGAKYLKKFGAQSAPIKMYDFPGSTCISVEHEGVHGVPGPKKLKEGHLVNIDVSAELNGFYADTGGSFVIGEGTKVKQDLCSSTKKALTLALSNVSDGVYLKQMGKTVESFAQSKGLTVVKNVGGHGVGRSLHEEPEFIANFYIKKDPRRFQKNSVVAIEPIISTGAEILEDKGDGWTLHHPDYYTAQFEHTVMVTEGEPYIFTRPTIDVA